MKLIATVGKWLDLPIGSSKMAWRKFWKDSLLAYLFLLPTLLVLGTFVFYPVVKAFIISFYEWSASPFVPSPYVGLQNYVYILKDPDFHLALKNTLIFVLGTIPAEIALALGIATLLNKGLRFRAVYRFAVFVPYVTTVVAIAMVWRFIYDTQYGLLNFFLAWFGLTPQKWLEDPKWTMLTIILMSIWKTLGYTSVIFLAGLQNVDKELYNAAKVDGANDRQVFWNVTWPLLSPTTFFVTITSLIGAFKVFTEVYVLYGRSPGVAKAGLTIVFYVYEKAWTERAFGASSAAAYILFFLVLAVTAFQLWFSKTRVHYD